MAPCTSVSNIHILDLPEIVIEKIMSFLSYEEVAHLRIVCRRFDNINQMVLNKGFRQVEKYQSKCMKEIKSQLPRRESERKNHPLFRHSDILTAIETRLSLLNMTFMKYVDNKVCCFIPGKVIDEIYRVLRFVQTYRNKPLPMSHEVLTELRDISSMAMEHFEEKIVSSLRPVSHATNTPRFSLSSAITSPFATAAVAAAAAASTSTSTSQIKSHPISPPAILNDLATANKYYKCYISNLKKDVCDMKLKVNELRRRMSEQEKVALEQNRIIAEQTIKLTSQEGKLAELSRKMLEHDQRLNDRLGGGGGSGGSRDKQGSSGTSTGWARDDNNAQQQQFFVTHGLTTSAISPAVFVPANILQPNFNLGGGGLASSPYFPSSPIPRFSSTSVSPGGCSSTILSPTVTPPAGYSASQCMQGSLASYSDHGSDSSQLDNISLLGSTTSSEPDSILDKYRNSSRKRKYSRDDGGNDSQSSKYSKY